MKKILIALIPLLLISLFVCGGLFGQDSELSERDTIIRLQFGGALGFSPSTVDEVDYSTFNMGFNYTRFFTPLMGLNVGLTLEFPIGNGALEGSSNSSFGLSFEAGPCFRLGQIMLSPMAGYGLVYQDSTLSNNDTEIRTEHYLRIVVGVDYFFNDFISISGEVGYIAGYVTDNYTVAASSTSSEAIDNPHGVCFSLGVGIAY